LQAARTEAARAACALTFCAESTVLLRPRPLVTGCTLCLRFVTEHHWGMEGVRMRTVPLVTARSPSSRRGPQILLYSHDTVGLGNIRRTLLLADAVAGEMPEASILVVTGSAAVHAFPMPKRVDTLKLPALSRTRSDVYRARSLVSRTREVKRARREILLAAARSFDPDLLIVDKHAAGVGGELLPTLEALRLRGRAKLVLGMRDVLDEPERTREVLRRSGGFDLITRYYEEVWIYGSAAVFDAIREYAFPSAVAAKTRFCGYLRFPSVWPADPLGAPGVLVTVGGGHDGTRLVRAYLEGLREFTIPGTLRSVVVLGPQMGDGARRVLRRTHDGTPGVRLVDFSAEMHRLYAGADVVVGMAGYATVCELLSQRKRAVLVPRATPVCEQTIRARRLAELGLFHVIEREELTPERLMHAVFSALDAPVPPAEGLPLDGLAEVQRRTRVLLAEATG
jgi:predicted glycosyltransferase